MDTSLNLDLTSRPQKNDALLRMLDSGIDDMESGREMPLENAFEQVNKLRNNRRNAGI